MNSKKQKYILSILLVLGLLAASLIGPEFMFAVRDRYQSGKTWQGYRNSLDIELINASYGERKERLTNFAEGLSENKTYYASCMDVALSKEEQYSILDQIMPLDSLGFTVLDWKKYIFFDNALVEDNTSVAFMTWYIEMSVSDGYSLKILVDTEDLTVYYIKVDDYAGAFDIFGEDYNISEQKYDINKKSKEYMKQYTSIKESMLSELNAYWQAYYAPEYVTYDSDTFPMVSPFRADLYFSDYSLRWELDYNTHLQMGLADLGALIPEFED